MDCKQQVEKRVEWLKAQLAESGAKGFVYGNSGGKDCTLVGILCKLATDNVTSIIMPCESSRNYGIDRDHALLVSEQYGINTIELDLTPIKKEYRKLLAPVIGEDCVMAYANINPRLRMITVYAYAYKNNCLVVGTGNRSEATMGYFTKWGDGAHDVNPIADLTVTEIFEMLRYLKAPSVVIDKAPSAGLYEGQTDEQEMGISYEDIDKYLLTGEGKPDVTKKIDEVFKRTAHKRAMPKTFKD